MSSYFVKDYFQLQIKTYFVIECVFTAAGRCMLDGLQINSFIMVMKEHVSHVMQEWSLVIYF